LPDRIARKGSINELLASTKKPGITLRFRFSDGERVITTCDSPLRRGYLNHGFQEGHSVREKSGQKLTDVLDQKTGACQVVDLIAAAGKHFLEELTTIRD
jgi:hypothetical protein